MGFLSGFEDTVDETVSTVEETAEDTVDATTTTVGGVVDDTISTVEETGDDLASGADDVAGTTADLVGEAPAILDEFGQAAGDAIVGAGETAGEAWSASIREAFDDPVTLAFGLAVLVGAVYVLANADLVDASGAAGGA